MRERVHERELDLVDADGTHYDRCFVYAEPQGGTWAGRIEFLADDGRTALETGRETTQSNAAGVAYWATGLNPTFLEGALHRAASREAPVVGPTAAGGRASEERDSEARFEKGEGVRMRLRTPDPEVPFRFMKTRTLVRGTRRYIHNGGVIVYEGPTANHATADEAYEFLVHVGSENAAGMMANRLWSDLHGEGVTLEVDGKDTQIQNAAIKDALLGAVARS